MITEAQKFILVLVLISLVISRGLGKLLYGYLLKLTFGDLLVTLVTSSDLLEVDEKNQLLSIT